MTHIYMVRHGRAAAAWDADLDPGLDAVGLNQAAALIGTLTAQIDGPVPIISSPLKRCRETAEPLAAHWGQEILIDPRVRELPSPTDDLTERGAWLRRVMAGTWSALDAETSSVDFRAWREGVVQAVAEVRQSPAVVIVSHFIAINVIYGRAMGQDDIVCFRPDNASVSLFRVEEGRVECVDKGAEAQTQVN